MDAGDHAPRGEVTIVFSDITCSATLWEFDPIAMRDATILHNEIARDLLRKHAGYEVISFTKDRNSGEGSFCLAFQNISNALEWCMEVQVTLLSAPWPESLLKHPGAAEEGDEKYVSPLPK
jgi:class 3 adenylate cyclase